MRTIDKIRQTIEALQERLGAEEAKENKVNDLVAYCRKNGLVRRDLFAAAYQMDSDKPKRGPRGPRTPAKLKVGKTIRESRRRKGIKSHVLAEMMGVHESSVGWWERGEGYPKPDIQPKLIKALDLSKDIFDER